MRFISTRVHGVLDYLMGMVLIAAPWMLGFADNSAATWVPVLLGVGVIVYSLFTDYELGVFRGISMRGHLWLDALSGIFLASSPWLFGFSDYVSTPHVILGVAEVIAALTTRTVPESVSLTTRNRSVMNRGTLGSRATTDTTTGMRGTIGGTPSPDIDIDKDRDTERNRRGGTL
jgi:hypothetical protein